MGEVLDLARPFRVVVRPPSAPDFERGRDVEREREQREQDDDRDVEAPLDGGRAEEHGEEAATFRSVRAEEAVQPGRPEEEQEPGRKSTDEQLAEPWYER
jgi:type IV secretory pathway VirB10-like protein